LAWVILLHPPSTNPRINNRDTAANLMRRVIALVLFCGGIMNYPGAEQRGYR
jgi:hypothetical protein